MTPREEIETAKLVAERKIKEAIIEFTKNTGYLVNHISVYNMAMNPPRVMMTIEK